MDSSLHSVDSVDMVANKDDVHAIDIDAPIDMSKNDQELALPTVPVLDDIDNIENIDEISEDDDSGQDGNDDDDSDMFVEDMNNFEGDLNEIDFDANTEHFLEKAPPGFDSITGHYTFQIKDLASLFVEKERFKGPSFEVGDYVFNLILVCQKRNHLVLSVYLEGHPKDHVKKENGNDNENDDDKDPGEVWSFPAHFTIDAWNPANPKLHKSNNTRFRYNQRVTDWGFVQFIDPKGAVESSFMKSNMVNITTYVRVIDDYTHVLYSNYRDYSSKKYTGYVGIENQGATCYLNSLLQSYFFTKSFRKKVYQIPTEDEIDLSIQPYSEYKKQAKTVSLALQRIFYKLQTSDVSIQSMELTHSFGWTTADAFTQHDVQELNRILMDRLETKMKGTEIDGCLNDIFVGKMKSFIRCINVDYESSRTEDFWDIQLNVKGMKNIKESFDNYIELEILDGDNKYDASGYGLQDAEKGVIFESFPDVLHIQLKRYEYDFETDNMVKINDRFEFFDEIDLQPYISKTVEQYGENWNYKLHGVLVHQGDVSVGHYYAMIKPNDEDKWFKFDDDIVSRVTHHTIYEEGFGCGAPENVTKQMTREEYQNYIIKHHTSAYMLVYIRESKIPDVLAEVEESDIPPHISKQIEYETAEEARIKKEREEMHLYVNFNLFTDNTFHKFEGFDIGPNVEDSHYFNKDLYDEGSFPLTFRILKTDSWKSIYTVICDLLGKDPSYADKLRLWNIVKRDNRTYRPDFPIDEYISNVEDIKIGDVCNKLNDGVSRRKYSGHERPMLISLYLEDAAKDLKYLANHSSNLGAIENDTNVENVDNLIEFMDANPNNDAVLEPILNTSNILVFIKYFSLKAQKLKSMSHLILPHESTVEFIESLINNILTIPDDTMVTFTEELSYHKRLDIKPTSTLYQSEISNGDIICATICDTTIDNTIKLKNADMCYEYLESRVHFIFSKLQIIDEDDEDYVFVDVSEQKNNSKNTTVDVWLSYNSTYFDLVTVIGEAISVDPEYIKLSHTSNNQKNDLRSDYDFKKSLANISKQNTIYLNYEILKIPLKQFEGMELYSIFWVGNGICKDERHDFYLPKSSTLENIVTKMQSKIDISDDEKDSAFCWIPDSSHKINKTLLLDDEFDGNGALVIGIFPQFKEIYQNQINNENVKLINGFQCYGSPENTHGLPFIFDVVRGEKFPDTMLRLRKLLGLSDKEFKCAKFGISGTSFQYFDKVESDTELFQIFERKDYKLFIDHPDRKSRRASHQSSITIK